MAYNKHTALVVFKVFRNVCLGLRIKVVSRLIKEQNLRLGEKHTAECHLGFLTARKLTHGLFNKVKVYIHFNHKVKQNILIVIAFVIFKQLLNLLHSAKQGGLLLLGKLGFKLNVNFVKLSFKLTNRATIKKVFPHGLLFILNYNFLRKIADTGVTYIECSAVKLNFL